MTAAPTLKSLLDALVGEAMMLAQSQSVEEASVHRTKVTELKKQILEMVGKEGEG